MKRVELIKYRGEKSQADMAKQYKVSQQAWSSWENGDKKPDVATMKQIERDSGIPMETLFFDVFNKRRREGGGKMKKVEAVSHLVRVSPFDDEDEAPLIDVPEGSDEPDYGPEKIPPRYATKH